MACEIPADEYDMLSNEIFTVYGDVTISTSNIDIDCIRSAGNIGKLTIIENNNDSLNYLNLTAEGSLFDPLKIAEILKVPVCNN